NHFALSQRWRLLVALRRAILGPRCETSFLTLAPRRSSMRSSPSTRRNARRSRPLLERVEDRLAPALLGPRAFDNGAGPSALALADMDGDGVLDVAASDTRSNTVNVPPGNGDGSFQRPRPSAARASPGSVAVGDLNGDGLLDVAVANGISA